MFTGHEEVGGASLDDHLAALARQGLALVADDGDDDDPLHPVLPPDEGAYLWDWWLELHQARTGNGFGPNPISYTEIASWSQVCHKAIVPWEVRALRSIDAAYLASWHAKPGGGGE